MCHSKEWIELGFLYPVGKKEAEGGAKKKKSLRFEKNIVHIIISQFVMFKNIC